MLARNVTIDRRSVDDAQSTAHATAGRLPIRHHLCWVLDRHVVEILFPGHEMPSRLRRPRPRLGVASQGRVVVKDHSRWRTRATAATKDYIARYHIERNH
jgi:hypothetical protein